MRANEEGHWPTRKVKGQTREDEGERGPTREDEVRQERTRANEGG